MPDCPFSPDRLREMRFEQGWRIDQIATLGAALADTAVTEDDVREWFAAAGLRTTLPSLREGASARLPSTGQKVDLGDAVTAFVSDLVQDKPRRGRPAGTTLDGRIARAKQRGATIVEEIERERAESLAARTKPCSWCGKPIVRRAPSEFKGEHQYCSTECQNHMRAHHVKLNHDRIAEHVSDFVKKCAGTCGRTLPLASFSVDKNRADGRSRICLECNKAKSRAYYEANRERLIARVQSRRKGVIGQS